jgi:hypothetical protein
MASWLAHRREMATIQAALAQARLQTQTEARTQKAQARERARQARAARPKTPSLAPRLWSCWQRQRATGERAIQRQSLRHAIQAAGHEYLALILMIAAAGGSLLFFLGRYYGSAAPLYIVIPAAALLALSIEWATATFGQDMQDSLTLHQPAKFLLTFGKALVAYSVSVFMLANAASVVWAPLDNLLGIDRHTWAWVLGITVFGVQFLLKLTPERPRAARNIVAVSHFVAMMAPEATPEEQIAIAARMLGAFSSQPQVSVMERQQGAPPALSSANHHPALPANAPLAPVFITDESEGEGHAENSFRH